MKKFVLIGVMSLIFSTVASACLQKDNISVCPNDSATVESAHGKVLGVNPIKNLVSIRFENGLTQTYSIDRVSVGKGCLQGYCVNDRATVEWLSGQIIGINPITQKISIRFENGLIQTYSIDRVSVGKGCLQGYCMNDGATVEWLSGQIVGINPIAQKISVLFENGLTQTYSIDRVSINSYCLKYPERHEFRLISSKQEFSSAFNH